ncbi:hypothetical protein A3842_06865 [Paenibacillus sp. P3E]|uniref:hypothetical protein n=1 Tax=Paenibacillus sp. P3E TaxID=1349435 RepID=UPI00095D6D14|nr:hypothetical protein [Paenibacillus sp. P3E]OKP86116.1 hypothetical protein A3842_06865 [Paenibacillus sp. P3E]
MNGELHQMLLITALGNGNLISGADASNTELEHTEYIEVRFIEEGGGKVWSWPEWLAELKNNGCRRLMLNGMPSATSWSTGILQSNGMPNGVTSLGTTGESLWKADWHMDQYGSRTKWKVTYTEQKLYDGQKGDREFLPLSVLSEKLDVALRQIGDLAYTIEESFWSDHFFEPAKSVLNGTGIAAQLSFHLPDIYKDQARTLLNAVYKAWVFGGMGSWNDSPPYSAYQHDREQEFNTISARLYETLVQCARGAVNSVVLL